jgi:hypothetical protein
VIWPWTRRLRELESDIRLQAGEIVSLRESLRIAEAEKAAEVARRISAEALAYDRKEALARTAEDIATARADAKEAKDGLVSALIAANLRLSSPREEKPPDMDKIRQMASLSGDREEKANAMARARQNDIAVRRALFHKFYPGLVARGKPTPLATEGPPPGTDQRPSLEATG